MNDLFSEKAREWDANEMIVSLSAGIGKTLLDNLELTDKMHVMDFGAGTGLLTSQVAARVGKVTAVDVSQAMLEQLAAKDSLADKVQTLCQDITHQPIDTRFDLIVSAMAMHHVEDTDKLLKTFAAHLKPGAKIALADLDAEDGSFHPEDAQGVFHHGFDRSELQARLENHGFRNVKFMTAHTVEKPEKHYPVFLVIATGK